MANSFDIGMADQMPGFFEAFGVDVVINHVAADATETLLPNAIFDQSTPNDMEYLDASGQRIPAEALLTIPTGVVTFDMANDHILIGEGESAVQWRAIAHDVNSNSLQTFLITRTRHVTIRTIKTRRSRS